MLRERPSARHLGFLLLKADPRKLKGRVRSKIFLIAFPYRPTRTWLDRPQGRGYNQRL
jgi:hypothetical protein